MNIKRQFLANIAKASTTTNSPSVCSSINNLISMIEIEDLTIGFVLSQKTDGLPSAFYETALATVIDQWELSTPERNIADHFLALVIVLEQNPDLFPESEPLKSVLLSDDKWIECANKEQRRASNQYGFIMSHINALRESNQ